jgi:two-component system chemotaxis response regulator CheB
VSDPIQVLVVDDSAVVRGLLVSALSNVPEIKVVGTAMHGETALKQLRAQSVDVVLLDVEMPVMDGLTALPRILAEFPDTRVVMVSSLTQSGAASTVRALALGAAACIAKPVTSSVSQTVEKLAAELVPLVKALGRSTVCQLVPNAPPNSGRARRLPAARAAPDLIVIGSSTGGPNALSSVLTDLTPDVSCPILIVQHMPPTFTSMLAKHLEKDSGRPCQEAVPGGIVEQGKIYVAPGDFHLAIDRESNQLVTTLNQGPPQHFCRPSVNPLFLSAAEHCGNRTLAVMLTGMGDDGIEGTREIDRRGGTILIQDEATSVVWGMPGAVARAGLADEILPLGCIAQALAHYCVPGRLVR